MGARLYLPPARWAGAEVVLNGDEHRYLCRVLRLCEGDRLTVFDGCGHEGEAVLARSGARDAALRLGAMRPATGSRALDLTLVIGLCKGERMDLVVQKATELGAARLIPVVTVRSVPRLEAERARGRLARWAAIGHEAARQCGRADVLAIDEITPFAEAVAAVAAPLKVLFWEEAAGARLRDLVPAFPPAAAVVAVGPEGGFAAAEVAQARAAGFAVASLGPRILRAETAAITALAVVGYVLGEIRARATSAK